MITLILNGGIYTVSFFFSFFENIFKNNCILLQHFIIAFYYLIKEYINKHYNYIGLTYEIYLNHKTHFVKKKLRVYHIECYGGSSV